MRVSSVSAIGQTYPVFKKNNNKPAFVSFSSKMSYQTQNERVYLLATLAKVKDLTPNSMAGFKETLFTLRESDFNTYKAVIHTLGSLPEDCKMKYSALEATTAGSPFRHSNCSGVKVTFDINPSPGEKTYNASEERYGDNLDPTSIAANVVVENAANYLENRNDLSGKEMTELKLMKQYISDNCTTYFYMPVI